MVAVAQPAVAAIEIRGVSKTFVSRGRSVAALASIDLSVEPGEFAAIIGPSGCGKTTLLEILDGLVTPSSGTVLVNGRPVTGPGSDRAIVFQEYALFPWLTVAENLAFALREQGTARKAWPTMIDRQLMLVGLEEFSAFYPRQLSGGMRQRAALARALVAAPDLLLLDEPFAAVDAITRHQLQLLLARVAGPERTVVLVTHSLDEAVLLADTVWLLSKRPARVSARLPVPGRRGEREPAMRAGVIDFIWSLLNRELGADHGDRRP